MKLLGDRHLGVMARMRKYRNVGVCSAFVLIAMSCDRLASHARCAETMAEMRGEATLVLQGVVSERENVVTGEYTAIEHRYDVSQSDDRLVTSRLRCVFDRLTKSIRFDRVHNLAIEGSDIRERGITASTESLDIESVTSKYVCREDKSIHWTSLSPFEVLIKQPTEVLLDAEPFDVTSIGVATTGDMKHFPNIQNLINVFSSQHLSMMDTTGSGVKVLSWTFADGKYSRTLWIDPGRGYIPVRMEVKRNSGVEPAGSPYELRIATKWEMIDNVWVPLGTRHVVIDDDGERCVYELAINWESVNKPVDQRVFTPKGLGVAGFAQVADDRLGTPIVTEKLGVVDQPASSLLLKGTDDGNAVGDRVSIRLWLVLANLCLLLVAGCVVLLRRR